MEKIVAPFWLSCLTIIGLWLLIVFGIFVATDGFCTGFLSDPINWWKERRWRITKKKND